MDEIRLVAPVPGHEADALAFADEVMRADGGGIHGSSELFTTAPYSQWLENIALSAAGRPLPHLSPSDTFFAERGGVIVGVINIRHALTSEFMQRYGGHIGYTVRPCERGKGYAAEMLRLALERCRELGIHDVLLTCDPANVASIITIENCGGVFESEIPFPGTDEPVRRYWIQTG